ncbi:MAG: hypothetical protein IKR40_07625 [Treponema sp.]|nr:hypothetical protein [Treponema sp.]
MKKLVPLIAVLSFALTIPLAAKNLYIQNKSPEEEEILTNDVIAQIAGKAKSVDLTPVDYNTLNLVPYTSYWGEYQRLPLESEKRSKRKRKG